MIRLGRILGLFGDRGGNVAVMFALASVPLLAFTGAAIDYGLATRLQARLQAATDATTLLLCQTSAGTDPATLRATAQTSLNGYMAPAVPTLDSPLGYVAPGVGVARQVTVTAHLGSATFFSAFTRVPQPLVSATSQCTTPIAKTFEIALVLDTTGSMMEQSNGTTKLAAVQQAARNFLGFVQQNAAFTTDTRVSIVPFAAAVAVNPNDVNNYRTASWVDTKGKSAYHWTNIDKNNLPNGFTSRFDVFKALKAVNPAWDWAGCLETLPYPQNVQDVSPTSDPNTLYVPLFAPDEPGLGNNSLGTQVWNASNFGDWNSYITDVNIAPGCIYAPIPSLGLNVLTDLYFAAERNPCKYVSPLNGLLRSASSYFGFDLGQNGPNWACTSKPLQRLTKDYSALTGVVNALSAAGSTNIHEGFMWGWRTLSPNSVFKDGAAYTDTAVNKIIILMTDGMNDWLAPLSSNPNNSVYNALGYLNNADGSTPSGRLPPGFQNPTTNLYNPYDTSSGSGRSAIDQLTKLACQNAKAAGVSVYTIAFSVPSDPIDANGQSLLKGCASAANQYYLENDSNGVISAFAAIAKSIGSLRISR